MFILKKIIASFLLPPGMFVSMLSVCGIWLFSRKRWKKGFIICAIAVIMWTISTTFFADIMIRGLENNYEIPKSPMGDVIVLLGGGISNGAEDFSGIGSPSGEMMLRTVTAVRLQKLLNIPVIVSGGRIYNSDSATEAGVVRRFLEDLGVPHNKIIEETSSRDTIENAEYTGKICSGYGYKRLILVTSAFHMKRSVKIFRKAGLEVLPFPVNFKTWKNKIYGWQDFLPVGFDEIATAMHEYIGLLYYELAT